MSEGINVERKQKELTIMLTRENGDFFKKETKEEFSLTRRE